MPRRAKLHAKMTLAELDNGYWYATELKTFAVGLGIPGANKLRKDELERALRAFLKDGTLASPTKRALTRTGERDTDRGLRLALPIRNYTNDRETKMFLLREARKLAPDFKERSGARYRLNRWREEQLTRGAPIRYADLVREYVRLCAAPEPFAKIPHGRYINFVADFLAHEPNATHAGARRAWSELKRSNIPKTYRAWAQR